MEEIKYIGKCLLIEEKGKIEKVRDKIKESVLVVGDLHLGYEQALEESGVFLG